MQKTIQILAKQKIDKKIDVAIVFAKLNNEWLLCKHRDRSTWEIPGGHIEKNESLIDGAKRELFEETGTTATDMKEVCFYSIDIDGQTKHGVVYFAEIEKIEKLPNHEMKEIKTFKTFPSNVTYKETYNTLLPIVKKFLST